VRAAGRCKPNGAHYAITALQQKKQREDSTVHVLTQNIDRLHHASHTAVDSIVELHGSLWLVKPENHPGFLEQDGKVVLVLLLHSGMPCMIHVCVCICRCGKTVHSHLWSACATVTPRALRPQGCESKISRTPQVPTSTMLASLAIAIRTYRRNTAEACGCVVRRGAG
jgi:hypothetical protein